MRGLENHEPWVALAIGNSHLHWAYFCGPMLQRVWIAPHVSADMLHDIPANHWPAWSQISPALKHHLNQKGKEFPLLWVASVVPSQTLLWRAYPRSQILGLEHIPLKNTYETLGIDRALATWAAGLTYGWPVLVIDGGTALTLTGADTQGQFVGGAILPGLALQMRSLHTETAALPDVTLPPTLPPRWATETQAAIQSGIIHTVIAGLHDAIQTWYQQFPHSQIVLTGGDHDVLYTYLQTRQAQKFTSAAWQSHLVCNAHLLFKGMQLLHQRH